MEIVAFSILAWINISMFVFLAVEIAYERKVAKNSKFN